MVALPNWKLNISSKDGSSSESAYGFVFSLHKAVPRRFLEEINDINYWKTQFSNFPTECQRGKFIHPMMHRFIFYYQNF